MTIETMEIQEAGSSRQFLVWHRDIPYMVDYLPHGAGYFDLLKFVVADSDFLNSLADEPRELFADPDDVKGAGSPIKYLEGVFSEGS